MFAFQLLRGGSSIRFGRALNLCRDQNASVAFRKV